MTHYFQLTALTKSTSSFFIGSGTFITTTHDHTMSVTESPYKNGKKPI